MDFENLVETNAGTERGMGNCGGKAGVGHAGAERGMGNCGGKAGVGHTVKFNCSIHDSFQYSIVRFTNHGQYTGGHHAGGELTSIDAAFIGHLRMPPVPAPDSRVEELDFEI